MQTEPVNMSALKVDAGMLECLCTLHLCTAKINRPGWSTLHRIIVWAVYIYIAEVYIAEVT